jgi:hypothetical protein
MQLIFTHLVTLIPVFIDWNVHHCIHKIFMSDSILRQFKFRKIFMMYLCKTHSTLILHAVSRYPRMFSFYDIYQPKKLFGCVYYSSY